MLIIVAVAIPCAAQEKSGPANPQSTAPALSNENRPSPLPPNLALETRPELRVGKKWRITGPWVSLFKARSVREVPKKLFSLINPFPKTEEGETRPPPALQRYRDLSPRPWSTVVGWHPTASASPDPMTHEGNFGVMTFNPSP